MVMFYLFFYMKELGKKKDWIQYLGKEKYDHKYSAVETARRYHPLAITNPLFTKKP